MTSKCLQRFHSKYTADVVEWNPNSSNSTHSNSSTQCILATYFLNKDETRTGSLEGFQIDQRGLLQRTFILPVNFGIFDVKFNLHQSHFLVAGSGKTVLYQLPIENIENVENIENIENVEDVEAEHSIHIKDTIINHEFKLSNESEPWNFGSAIGNCPKELATFSLEDPSVMCTSVDYNNRKLHSEFNSDSNSNADLVSFVSMSSGELAILKLVQGDDKICALHQWQAHDLEAWIVASNHFEPNVFYSGGDDAMFKGWDMRIGGEMPLFRNKTHRAGVCCIQMHPTNENKLVTGSYDSHVYLWDTRSMGRPLDTFDTGGGVWRAKWNPFRSDLLMLACMRTSFQFLRILPDDKFEYICTATIDDGENLAYGCDWCLEDAKNESFHVATCSFYDKQFQWRQIEIPY